MQLAAICAGDRRALARAITLLESSRADDRAVAEQLLRAAMPHCGRARRVAFSGAPGVGKSTFIEAFGNCAIQDGGCIAVLTIDPSSSLGGGSILGDKTRMETLATHPRAFIRPSPSGQTLGGVARRTHEAILLCEAAGFDWIVVETVGVGQSETLAANMTDAFVLLLTPHGGDELQGVKRGIMELADLIVVNKADGALLDAANAFAAVVADALRWLARRVDDWQTPVLCASALDTVGIDAVHQKLIAYFAAMKKSGALHARRQAQAKQWLWNETREALLGALGDNAAVNDALGGVLREVEDGKLPASVGARQLVDIFLNSNR